MVKEQGDGNGHVTGGSTFRNLLSPLPTPEVYLAGAGSRELLSAHKGEDTSNDSPSLCGFGESRGSH